MTLKRALNSEDFEPERAATSSSVTLSGTGREKELKFEGMNTATTDFRKSRTESEQGSDCTYFLSRSVWRVSGRGGLFIMALEYSKPKV
jgi:hypothetical protein